VRRCRREDPVSVVVHGRRSWSPRTVAIPPASALRNQRRGVWAAKTSCVREAVRPGGIRLPTVRPDLP
jgi:hypothetical protein